MIKLLIKSIEPYAYILSSEDKEYRLHLEFLGLEKKPELVIIFICQKIL